MSTALAEKIAKIPKEKEKEVEAFLDSILSKEVEPLEKPKPMFGALKGTIIMADDFDEPLDDFKEYM